MTNVDNSSLWNPKPLPTRDCLLLNRLGISYYDLVFADYKLVWDLIAEQHLNAKDVQRIKHIRKREKNKLFSKGQFHTLEQTIGDLQEEKFQLLMARDLLEQECEYWGKKCSESLSY
eukprot:TRINITY_DN8639_c0_g1_i1.p1 TRINITY_DN8639_c0_g1~~TRINITY_DN8639_c0_g1_i1.p1  ORF type:complete len:117 (-),score=14.39 TRINITY_DN8639_c0_g1_i1:69-419(-)